MTEKTATDSVARGLADHLKKQIVDLESSTYGWPDPNEAMKMPCATVFVRTPKFQSVSPYTSYKGEVDGGKVGYRKVVGSWEFSLQIDLWAAYKPQRDSLVEELIKLFSADDTTGVSIQMATYYDEWVSFSIGDDVEFVDDEQTSQRGEWRARIIVLASCNAVTEHTGFVMEEFENNIETPTTDIEAPEEPDGAAIV
jgi:hypothetical protein